ncbi:nuclear transport factor 2 family protein [Amycolatopsis benzoatilytica]|uniref:nuclear transport factor 2 family protein n=1 Tax=Amycolatopsis benzoatilytica TaxID=346045 RepID=UPI000379C819|nr:nuclear transport factor 2 family protein [Amycolatopsis benzoatilytica]
MTTPRDLFDQLLRGITEGRFADLAQLYTEDTVVEHPTAVPRPTRLEGRAALHARFGSAPSQAIRIKAHDVTVHETADPEVIVAEYRYTTESLRAGRTTESANIQVLRARDGLLAHTRDYHDYLQLALAQDATAGLPAAYQNAPAYDLRPAAPRPELSPPDSREGVFQRLVFGVADRQWSDLPDLYAAKTDVRHPFLPDSPVLRTRDDLRAHFSAAAASALRIEVTDLVLHLGTDPEVIIGESTYLGETGIGTPFQINNIFAMRVRDGHIVESRDYGDHLALAAATGRLPELLAGVGE